METFQDFQHTLQSINTSQDDSMKDFFRIFPGKWTGKIIFELIKCSPLRFGEIKAKIPTITNTMLAATLRELEGSGLVIRTQFNEIPPHVEYSLTEAGKALYAIYGAILQWVQLYGEKIKI